MTSVVLYQPEIAPNTGNIIRLCANSGVDLHLIEPFGFNWDDKKLRRAGLDYKELTNVYRYSNWDIFQEKFRQAKIVAFSTKVSNRYDQILYSNIDFILFGPETRGLPSDILSDPDITSVTIPMASASRSINLSNAVAIGLYESLRQQNFIL